MPIYPPPIARQPAPASLNALGWVSFGVVLGLFGITLAWTVPPPVLGLALSVLMVLAGLLLAAFLYIAGFRLQRDRIPGWDIAGALTFLGFAGALLVDNEQALAVLDQLRAR